MRRRKKLNFTSTGQNGNFSLNLPVNVTVHSVHVVKNAASGALVLANFQNIQNKVNGELVMPKVDATFIDEYNKRHKAPAEATNNVFSIYFEMVGLQDKSDREKTSHMGGLQSDWLSFDVVGATTPSFDIYIEYDDLRSVTSDYTILRYHKYTDKSVPDGTETSFNGFDYGTQQNKWIKEILWVCAGTIDLVRLEYGPGREHFFESPASLNDDQASRYGYVTKGAYFKYALDLTDTGKPEMKDTTKEGYKTNDNNVVAFFTDTTGAGAEDVVLWYVTTGAPTPKSA